MTMMNTGWEKRFDNYVEQLGHQAPRHPSDLRLVLSAHSAAEHDHHQVVYTTQYGETRLLAWLTKDDAHRRAKVLKARGYRVFVSTMPV